MSTQITYRFPVPTDLELEPFFNFDCQVDYKNQPEVPPGHLPQLLQSQAIPSSSTNPSPLLIPGMLVRIYLINPNNPREFFGCTSRPVLVLRHVSPKLTLVAPVVKTARHSSLFPPLLMDGHPYYLSIPNLRIIHTSRIRAVRRLGEISESSLKRLCLHINYLLALDNHP